MSIGIAEAVLCLLQSSNRRFCCVGESGLLEGFAGAREVGTVGECGVELERTGVVAIELWLGGDVTPIVGCWVCTRVLHFEFLLLEGDLNDSKNYIVVYLWRIIYTMALLNS